MARLWTDGAEFGDTSWFSSLLSQPLVASTTRPRSGTYCYRPQYGTETACQKDVDVSEFYLRFAVEPANSTITVLHVISAAGTEFTVRYDYLTSRFALHNSAGTAIITSDALYPFGYYYVVEVHAKMDDSTGAYELKVDGISAGTFSGDTKMGSATTYSGVRFQGNNTNWGFDDIACNDTTGASDNSWCGDGRVELLMPNGTGNYSQWTGSDSNSTDNYALVDELPPSSSDYVEDSTSENKDSYTVADFTGTGKQILRVVPVVRAMNTVPEGAQLKIGVRVNGSNYLSDAITLTGSYYHHMGSNYIVNPDDSAEWEDADLDSIELLLETV